MTLPSTKTELTAEMLSAIEQDLRQGVSKAAIGLPSQMRSMIDHHFGWGQAGGGGKRIRPLLTLLSCGACGGEWRQAIPAASAVEMVHNFSLVHDDIQDRSELRRGRPTLWTRWGVSQAINTGDALFALALRGVFRLKGFEQTALLLVQRYLLDACVRLTEGQHLDLAFESLERVSVEQYTDMVRGKTGSLLAASAAIGAILGDSDAPLMQAYYQFGLNLGLAFQINDDILGIWGDSGLTGKSNQDDLLAKKKSFPLIYAQTRADLAQDAAIGDVIAALEATQARARSTELAEGYTSAALEALDQAHPTSPYGDELRRLTRQLLDRDR